MVNYESEIRRLQAEEERDAIYQAGLMLSGSGLDSGMPKELVYIDREGVRHYSDGSLERPDGSIYNPPGEVTKSSPPKEGEGDLGAGDRSTDDIYRTTVTNYGPTYGDVKVTNPDLLEMMEEKRRRDAERTPGTPEHAEAMRNRHNRDRDRFIEDQYMDDKGRPLMDEHQDHKVIHKHSDAGRITRKRVNPDGKEVWVEDRHDASAFVDDPSSDHHGASYNPHTHEYDRRRKRVVKRSDVGPEVFRGEAESPKLDDILEPEEEFGNVGMDESGNPQLLTGEDNPLFGVDAIGGQTAEGAAVGQTRERMPDGTIKVTNKDPYGGPPMVHYEQGGFVDEATGEVTSDPRMLSPEERDAALDAQASANAALAAAAQEEVGAHDAALGGEDAIRKFREEIDRGNYGITEQLDQWNAEEAELAAAAQGQIDAHDMALGREAENRFLEENALTPAEIEEMSQAPLWPVDLEGRGPSRVPGSPPIQDPSFPQMPMQNIPGPGSPDLSAVGNMPQPEPPRSDAIGESGIPLGADPLISRPAQSPQAMINSMNDDQIARLRKMIPDPAMAALVIGQLMGSGANINQMNPQGSPMPPVPVPANPGVFGSPTHVPMAGFFKNLPMGRQGEMLLNNQIPLNTQLQMRQGMAPVPGLGGAPFPAPVSPLQSGNEQAIRNLLQQVK
tara:strand:- start:708 stop:2723 length:2016 start_codon:yes stop_codon:yes gene_type:complete